MIILINIVTRLDFLMETVNIYCAVGDRFLNICDLLLIFNRRFGLPGVTSWSRLAILSHVSELQKGKVAHQTQKFVFCPV